MNARHFGRSTEKLSTLPGQINIFNEAEAAIEQVAVRKKQKGKRKENLSRLPKRVKNHELTKEQLKEIFGDNGWKRLPDEVFSRVEYQPAVKEVVEHHITVYAAKKADVDTIIRADRPVDLLRNSIATPSLVAAIMNAKYTNAIPLYRIAHGFEQNDMLLSRATIANRVIRCSKRYLSLVYDRLQEHLCKANPNPICSCTAPLSCPRVTLWFCTSTERPGARAYPAVPEGLLRHAGVGRVQRI